jgi:hypothetical protein
LAFHRIMASGPVPPLDKGESLLCNQCGSQFSKGDAQRLWSKKHKKGRCPDCGAFGQFILRKPSAPNKSISDRWPGGIAGGAGGRGWTAVPELLLQHQKLIGLSASDLVVLMNLELHRRRAKDQVYPSAATIARRSGLGERTVRLHMKSLADRGLIEVTPHRRPDGSTSSNRSTANGLRSVLTLIASNIDAGRPPEHNVAEHLDALAPEVSAEPVKTGTSVRKRAPRRQGPAKTARAKR